MSPLQALVVEKVARALVLGGSFLFTAQQEPLEWLDGMTDRPSHCLGAETYKRDPLLLRREVRTGNKHHRDSE